MDVSPAFLFELSSKASNFEFEIAIKFQFQEMFCD